MALPLSSSEPGFHSQQPCPSRLQLQAMSSATTAGAPMTLHRSKWFMGLPTQSWIPEQKVWTNTVQIFLLCVWTHSNPKASTSISSLSVPDHDRHHALSFFTVWFHMDLVLNQCSWSAAKKGAQQLPSSAGETCHGLSRCILQPNTDLWRSSSQRRHAPGLRPAEGQIQHTWKHAAWSRRPFACCCW